MENQKDGANVRIPPPLIGVVGIAIAVILNRLIYPLRLDMSNEIVQYAIGGVLIVDGVFLMFSSIKHFKRTNQDPEPWKPTPEIITDGVYRFTRNPIYLGFGLIIAGLGILLNNLWMVIMVLPVWIAIHKLAVIPEEKYLEEKFGEEYLEYKKKVRRWI